MRTSQQTDGQRHSGLTTTVDNHHSRPRAATINNTSQSLPPGTTYNLDVALGRSDYQLARVMLQGPRGMHGISTNFKEGAELHVTRVAAEAMGNSTRESGLAFRTYDVTYTKKVGDTYLTHKIFDSNTALSSRYICVQDAVLTGSVLRLTFKNNYGGSATLWVKGKVLAW